MSLLTPGSTVSTANAIPAQISADEILTKKELFNKVIKQKQFVGLIMEFMGLGKMRKAENRKAYHYEIDTLLQLATVGGSNATTSGGKVVITLSAGSVTQINGSYYSYFKPYTNVFGSNTQVAGLITEVSAPTDSATHTLTVQPPTGVSAATLAGYFLAGQKITLGGSSVNSLVGKTEGISQAPIKYVSKFSQQKYTTPVVRADDDRSFSTEIEFNGGTTIYDQRVGEAVDMILLYETINMAFGSGESYANVNTVGDIDRTEGLYNTMLTQGTVIEKDVFSMDDQDWADVAEIAALNQIGDSIRWRGAKRMQSALELSAAALGVKNVALPYWGSGNDGSEQVIDLNVAGIRVAGLDSYFGTAGEFMLPNHFSADTTGIYQNTLFGMPNNTTVAYKEGGTYEGGAPQFSILYLEGSSELGSGRMATTKIRPENSDTKQIFAYAVQSELAWQTMNAGKGLVIKHVA